jgi:hypothetical protein
VRGVPSGAIRSPTFHVAHHAGNGEISNRLREGNDRSELAKADQNRTASAI